MSLQFLTSPFLAQSFTTCLADHAAKTTDFGSEGYTASLSDYHELLQLTAPDGHCGLVYVRGDFPNTADAVLARAQRPSTAGSGAFALKGSFGTRIHPDSHFELGEKQAQGLINLRWPYIQYNLKKKHEFDDGNSGTYEEISYVRDGTVFHIVRIKWGRGGSLSDYDLSTTIDKDTIKLAHGGKIQFGCPCSNGGPPVNDSFELQFANEKLSCSSQMYGRRLELQLFVNNFPRTLERPVYPSRFDTRNCDLSTTHDVDLYSGKPVFIVSTYSLRNGEGIDYSKNSKLNGELFNDIGDYLGVSQNSLNMTDRLWTALCSNNYESNEAVEVCVVGRSVEQILGVTSIPTPYKTQVTGVLDPTPLQDTGRIQDPRNEIPVALVRNIMTSQYVDVQSTL